MGNGNKRLSNSYERGNESVLPNRVNDYKARRVKLYMYLGTYVNVLEECYSDSKRTALLHYSYTFRTGGRYGTNVN